MINNEVIQDYLDRGLIRMQRHPELDLRILNYTVKTQWERLWDDVTLACRGCFYIFSLYLKKIILYDWHLQNY
jgi:hypothetical protein